MQRYFPPPSSYNLLIVAFIICSGVFVLVDGFAFHSQVVSGRRRPRHAATITCPSLPVQRGKERTSVIQGSSQRLIASVNLNENSILYSFRDDVGKRNARDVSCHSNAATDRSYDCPMNTFDYFSHKTEEWIGEELAYYRDRDEDYVPFVSNETGATPPDEHIEAAAFEFTRRFMVDRTEGYDDDVNNDKERSCGSPFLLVATNVRDDWSAPTTSNIPVRFMLVPTETKDASVLFIKSLAGPLHGWVDAAITFDIERWIFDNKLSGIIGRIDAGGKGYEPDKAYRPLRPDRLNPEGDVDAGLIGRPQARLVIETEYTNRNGRELRKVGFAAIQNPYTQLFLAIKFWSYEPSVLDFAAAVVLWGKNYAGLITVQKALDIGTRPVDTKSKLLYEAEGGKQDMLPPVEKWTRPKPTSPYASILDELESLSEELIDDLVQENPDWILTPCRLHVSCTRHPKSHPKLKSRTFFVSVLYRTAT